MIVLLILLYPAIVYASFCGESAIPFSVEILPNGQPILGCARPSCFGWNELGNPSTADTSFFSINNTDDGFLRDGVSSVEPYDPTDIKHYRLSRADCSDLFDSPNCDSSYQWVSGLAPQTNLSLPLKLRCCSIEPLIRSIDRGIATLKSGQIVIGGEVTKKGKQVAFDYIADITRVANEGIVYDVAVRRFECLPNYSKAQMSRSRSSKFSEARRLAFQAPTYESSDNAIALETFEQKAPSQTVIEGPFTEEQVAFPGVVKQNAVSSASDMSAAATDYLNQNSAYNGQYQQVLPPPPPSDSSLANVYAGAQQPSYASPPQPAYVAPPPPQYAVAAPQPPPQPPVQYYSPPAAPAAQPYYPSTSSYYCFSGDTEVRLLSGQIKRMDKLSMNDWVEQFGKSSVVYSPVTFWLHRMPEEMAEFLVIELEDGTKLKITDEHYIYKTVCSQERLVNVSSVPTKPVFAKEVQVGDCLYKTFGELTRTREVRVKSVGKTSERGIFAPMTTTSTISVNGILASCHSVYKPSNAVTTTYFKQMAAIKEFFFGKLEGDEMKLPMTLSLAIEMLHLVLPKSLLLAL